ncbi:MAG: Glu/Leu/Phe/Val dehydrogenase dimerization domain-containing protein [Bdellovibrionota bacterium]
MVFEGMNPASGKRSLCDGFEQLIFCNDPSVGLKAIISMHSTVLGPATGGCRMWTYASEQEAFTDVLRLSKGMTYKAAISGLNWGGGKAVIIGNPKTDKREGIFEKFGEYVDKLGGNYVTAKDVGIGADDLKRIKSKTSHVLGIEGEAGSSGDPSPATAWGVFHGIKACVKKVFGTSSLSGRKIALQGLGSVNYYLLEHLMAEGASVIGCDIDQAMLDRAVMKYRIETVNPDAIYDVPCDIFAPGALGAVINTKTLSRLKTKIIAGAANNQLATSEDGYEVTKRGMIYAPDYAINAGGLINIYYEGVAQGGYSKARAYEHVSRIENIIGDILDRAEAENLPTHIIADRIAEERVEQARRGQIQTR